MWANTNFCTHFLANFSIDKKKIESAALICWFVKIMLNLFYIISRQGREAFFDVSSKYGFNIGFHSDAYELISGKLGMVIDMTKL